MFERRKKSNETDGEPAREPSRMAAVFRRKSESATDVASENIAENATGSISGAFGNARDAAGDFTAKAGSKITTGVSGVAETAKDGLPEMPSLTRGARDGTPAAAGSRIPQPLTPTPPGGVIPPTAPKQAAAPTAGVAPRPPEPPKPAATAPNQPVAASKLGLAPPTTDNLHRKMPETKTPDVKPASFKSNPQLDSKTETKSMSDISSSSAPSFGATPTAASTPVSSTSSTPSFGASDSGRLIVGRDIELNGQVKNCELLIVEGVVEATLINTKALEVTEDGVFRGTAPVETAEISGLVEGDLIVDGHVLVRSTGIVNGNIQFGELEIERGGRVRGSMTQFGTQFGDDNKSATSAPAATAKPKAKRTRAKKS